MDITTSEEFESVVSKILGDVVSEVVDIIMQNNEELINEIVYNPFDPQDYTRTHDFLHAWDKETKGLESEMSYSAKDMTLDKANFIHGSEWAGYQSDVRNALAEIIYDGLSGDLFGDGYWTNKRDAWTPLIKRIDEHFDEWVIATFNKHGFECRRSTTGKVLFWK